jgi:2-polyprenyl-6-methoxyphenol hydroxylase-like FAD-dependent oxidoreductase
MLFDEVKDNVEFIFSNSISDLKQSAEEVSVAFASGDRRTFSLLLGCDGTHSTVRKLCFGEESVFSLFLQNYFSLASDGLWRAANSRLACCRNLASGSAWAQSVKKCR